ncbi:MAG: AzlD domain-containing protein [Candidimonas sp.]|jgi:branched-subunit amino acid transport protein
MQTGTVIWIVVVIGIGTYLIRLLPMLWHDRDGKSGARPANWRYALDAVGPSAIVALLVLSFWDMLSPMPTWKAGMPILAGLAGVWLGKHYLKTIAWATLGGVLAYGLVVGAMG